MQKALAIYEMQGNPDSDSVAEVLNSLSVLRSYQFDYTTASDLERRALAIWQKGHGPTYDSRRRALVRIRFSASRVVMRTRYARGSWMAAHQMSLQVQPIRPISSTSQPR